MPSKRQAAPSEPGECLMCKRTFVDKEGKTPEFVTTDAKVDIDAFVEDKFNQLPKLSDPCPDLHPRFEHSMPPEEPKYNGDRSVFLAGSIEMGKAVHWQRQMATELQYLPITVCNPRRGYWKTNVVQSANDAAFEQQVEWELTALEAADIICFFFDTNTISPVSMLELGLWAHSGKVIVCCGSRFWRAGNIHLVCERYKVPLVETFEELADAIKKRLAGTGYVPTDLAYSAVDYSIPNA